MKIPPLAPPAHRASRPRSRLSPIASSISSLPPTVFMRNHAPTGHGVACLRKVFRTNCTFLSVDCRVQCLPLRVTSTAAAPADLFIMSRQTLNVEVRRRPHTRTTHKRIISQGRPHWTHEGIGRWVERSRTTGKIAATFPHASHVLVFRCRARSLRRRSTSCCCFRRLRHIVPHYRSLQDKMKAENLSAAAILAFKNSYAALVRENVSVLVGDRRFVVCYV